MGGGRRRRREGENEPSKSLTSPSSPSHSFSSSSSSDFEFTISISPRKTASNLCPADELFYKGQLLPLHLSPRLSMVRTLLLASSSTSSSSDTNTTTSRDSTGSSNDSHSSFSSDLGLLAECDSSRPSSVTEEDELIKRLNHREQIKKPKYFSFSRFSSVFRKNRDQENVPVPVSVSVSVSASSVKRMSSSAKDVIRKYLKKVKPLYEKLSQKQQQQQEQKMSTIATAVSLPSKTERFPAAVSTAGGGCGGGVSNTRKDTHSFSGNLSLRYPRRRSCISSCPSSMRSSPSHSGVLCPSSVITGRGLGGTYHSDSSSMEELQSAIQGAIAHCKNSMAQSKSLVC
ncbi:probable membrane-associated kinase regulator 1 [Macadamia integrifolia]|uniref:probable membrane-associated kinase regulator 1 n=1 Tax=Macadamia integrifolia TaxID=60698 RepID=UPI001C52B4F4|nr:probable membrane-associated kinase regulator 1 [Macadamia integrifolia]